MISRKVWRGIKTAYSDAEAVEETYRVGVQLSEWGHVCGVVI